MNTETVLHGCSGKKMFLKYSQNSQINASARVSFLIKLQAGGLQLYQKSSDIQGFPANF